MFHLEFEYNIDHGSKHYGKTINSKFEMIWQRRAYDLALFYDPYQGLGGFRIRLNDFDFTGNGVPYVRVKTLQKSSDGLLINEL